MDLPVYMPPSSDKLKASRNILRSKSMYIRAKKRAPCFPCFFFGLNLLWNIMILFKDVVVYLVYFVWSGLVYVLLCVWAGFLFITPVHFGDEDVAKNQHFGGRSRGEYMTFFAVYGAASVAGTQMIASFVSNEDNFKQNHQYVILAVGGMVAVICFLTFYLILVYFTALNDPTPCKLIKIALNVFSCFGILAPGVSFIHWAVPVGAIAQPDMKLTPQKSQIIPRTRTYFVFLICYSFLLYLCALVVRLLGKIFKTA